MCRGHHWVWRPTHRRAIKEGSKVINRDWVKHADCRIIKLLFKSVFWKLNFVLFWTDHQKAKFTRFYAAGINLLSANKSRNWLTIKLSPAFILLSQSLNLDGRRGTTDDVATIPVHLSVSSAALKESPNYIPVHSVMLSSHVFFCLPLLLTPSLSPEELSSPCQRILRCCHTIWFSVSSLWLGVHYALQLHSGFCCELPRSSHALCRKCSEVSCSISSQGLRSFSRVLLSRKGDKMTVRISLA